MVAEYFDLLSVTTALMMRHGDEGDMIHVASLSYLLLAELALVNLAGVAWGSQHNSKFSLEIANTYRYLQDR